ncbi:thiamine-phosphate kinase [Acidobacteriota bacterium]
MKLPRLGEREIISALREEFSTSCSGVTLGIGDDAAALKVGKKYLLFTKDLLIEGVHFALPVSPPFFLGRKSLNVNLSDIAAMGGNPKFALLGLGIPARTEPKWLEEFFSGLKSASLEAGVGLIGGDISRAKKITISVTVIGEAKTVIRRDGARPGDMVFVSGTLGDARKGLFLSKNGHKPGDSKREDVFLHAFLNPLPQISLGQELSRRKIASSMIDVSDGLSVDLDHLCQESGYGSEIYLEKIPLSSELRLIQKNPFEYALHGGEDYQLLFTVSPEKLGSISRLQSKHKLALIGKIISGKIIFWVDRHGRKKRLNLKGYQHF